MCLVALRKYNYSLALCQNPVMVRSDSRCCDPDYVTFVSNVV